MRQRYGELLEAQQKADIILEEYLMDKTYLDYRKVCYFSNLTILCY
jgi:hypothetical protein